MEYFKNIDENEKPLDKLVEDGGFTSIFRTIGVIGDSLSSGEHESLINGVRNYHDYYEYSWGQYIARKCGVKVFNFTNGGIMARDFDNLSRYHRILTPENRCQAYIIALAVNDMGNLNLYKNGFGSFKDVKFSDCGDKNKDSFVGWYTKIIQKLRWISPKSRIFVVAPPKEVEGEPDHDRVSDFLEELTTKFEYVYCINLRKYAPVYDKDFKDIYYLGGHLNAMGYKLTGDMISSYVDYIIRHNYKDFKQAGFIGRDWDLHNEEEKW